MQIRAVGFSLLHCGQELNLDCVISALSHELPERCCEKKWFLRLVRFPCCHSLAPRYAETTPTHSPIMKSSGILTQELLAALKKDFSLDWYGFGVKHLGCVRANGLRLASVTGANTGVVELFAVLHESRRRNDGHDPNYGSRGAENATRLRGQFYELDDGELGASL